MTGEAFEPKNELEQRLVAAQAGQLPSEAFFQELLGAQVFMPVQDEEIEIKGFQRSTRAQPLVLEDEDGSSVLVLFTSPERARDFVRGFPGYGGGLLTEFKWILERVGAGVAITLNPGWEVGFDIDADMVADMIRSVVASPGQ